MYRIFCIVFLKYGTMYSQFEYSKSTVDKYEYTGIQKYHIYPLFLLAYYSIYNVTIDSKI